MQGLSADNGFIVSMSKVVITKNMKEQMDKSGLRFEYQGVFFSFYRLDKVYGATYCSHRLCSKVISINTPLEA